MLKIDKNIEKIVNTEEQNLSLKIHLKVGNFLQGKKVL